VAETNATEKVPEEKFCVLSERAGGFPGTVPICSFPHSIPASAKYRADIPPRKFCVIENSFCTDTIDPRPIANNNERRSSDVSRIIPRSPHNSRRKAVMS
jgi:hypothetical protein